MSNTIYKCKNCDAIIDKNDEFCSNCNSKLLTTGRKIELTIDESISISDKLKSKTTLRWDSNALGLFGIIITIFLSVFAILESLFELRLIYSLFISIVIPPVFIIAVTKINWIKKFLLNILRWILE